MKRLNEIDWKSKTPEEIDAVLAERIAYYEESIARNGGRIPKRQGFVVERIADIDNLRAADKEAQAGKVRINRHIRRHNLHVEKDLRDLQMMILTLEFPDPEYTTMRVKSDAGKVRDIAKQKYFPWRILHHAVMRIVGPVILRHLIYDTFACIKGKGIHFGVKRMKMMLRRYPEYRYFVKTDYKKFYLGLLHSIIERGLRTRFKDEHLFMLIDISLFTYDSGEEIRKELEDEERRKRCTHWRVYKPAVREFRDKPYRPLLQGEDAYKVPSAILRRHHIPCPDEG